MIKRVLVAFFDKKLNITNMIIKPLSIPDYLMQIRYNARIIPNGIKHDIKKMGANCQVFAFYILRQHGLFVPEYRSSELWADTEYSEMIQENFEPLDIFFFHKKEDAYGAHVGVYLGNNKVIHNAKKIGLPVIWEVEDFFDYPQYKYFLGAKRFYKEQK